MLAQGQIDAAGSVSLLAILVSAAVTDNILLTRFLGMCPFLAVSRELRPAFGMGLAVVFVTTCTCGINSLLYWYVLAPLAKYGVPAESLKLILFIIVIAAFVQLMEMVTERISLKLYFSLGIFLPLITVNCAILGTSLFMVNKVYGGLEALLFGFGSGAGWMMAIVLMAGIRQRLKHARIPPGLEGPGITLIIAGIMALAFIGFSGVIKM
ncbi:MAG: Rnf-Nqr domain containing protein [Planctomycetota bacterium]|jgi:Na+-transporting NADH:ubiquinone oxidoreductase subunit E